jgi:tetratricopeptide (TPR) repeat protein
MKVEKSLKSPPRFVVAAVLLFLASAAFFTAAEIPASRREYNAALLKLASEGGDALEAWKAFVTGHPDFVPGYSALAEAFLAGKKAEEGMEFFRRRAAGRPGLPGPHFALGKILAESNDFEACFAPLEKALELAPAQPECFVALPAAWRRARRESEGRAYFEGLAKKPRFAAAAEFALGELDRFAARQEDALKHYEKAEAFFLKQDFVSAAMHARLNKAVTLKAMGKMAEAADVYKETMTVRESLGELSETVDCLQNLATAESDAGEFQNAMLYAREGIERRRAMGDRKKEAFGYNTLGTAYEGLGDYKAAEENYRRAMEMGRESGNAQVAMWAVQNLGNIYRKWGDMEESIRCREEALGMARALGDRVTESFAMTNLGITYFHQSNFREALDHILQGLRIREEMNNKPGITNSLATLAVCYYSLGDLAKAEALNQRALQLSREIQRPYLEGVLLNNLGALESARVNYPKALRYFEESLALNERIGDRQGQAFALQNIASCYDHAEEFGKAREFALRAMEIFASMNQRYDLGDATTRLASIEARSGNYEEASWRSEEALHIALEIRSAGLEVLSRVSAAHAQVKTARLAEALEHYFRSIELLEASRTTVSDEALRASFLGSKLKIYEEAAEVLLMVSPQDRPARAGEAFHIAERVKARTFLDKMTQREKNSSVPPELAARRRELETRIEWLREKTAP